MSGIKFRSAVCKANILPAVLSLSPSLGHTQLPPSQGLTRPPSQGQAQQWQRAAGIKLIGPAISLPLQVPWVWDNPDSGAWGSVGDQKALGGSH